MAPELNGPNERTLPCEVPSISLETEKFCPGCPSDRDKTSAGAVEASKAGEHNS